MIRDAQNKQSGEGSTGLHSTVLKLQNSVPQGFMHAKNKNGFIEHLRRAQDFLWGFWLFFAGFYVGMK